MDSQRLPLKILKKINEKTILNHISDRMKKVNDIDQILLVTGDYQKNALLIKEAQKLGLDFFSGSENNVLDRFNQASNKFGIDIIIRVTGDNPLIDYSLINAGLKIFLKNNYDLVSNNRKQTFPIGYNFEIFTRTALHNSWLKQKNLIGEDEFSSTFISPSIDMLKSDSLNQFDLLNDKNLSDLRLSIDTAQDFDKISKIFGKLYTKNPFFELNDVLKFLN